MPKEQKENFSRDLPEKKQTCYHKVLHTERLFKALSETEFSGRGATVIETYCADCGLFIKQVEIRYE